jgi:hypothetical protein
MTTANTPQPAPDLSDWVPPIPTSPAEAWANYRTHRWSPAKRMCLRCGASSVSLWADWPCPAHRSYPVEVFSAVLGMFPEWGWWPKGMGPEVWNTPDPESDPGEYGDD